MRTSKSCDGRASAYLGQKKFMEASKSIGEALKLDGENIGYLELQTSIQVAEKKDAEERRLAAEAAAREAEAKRLAEAAAAKKAEEERLALEANRRQAVEHTGRASTYLGQKNFAEASKSISEALKLDAGNVAYVNLQRTIQEQEKADTDLQVLVKNLAGLEYTAAME